MSVARAVLTEARAASSVVSPTADGGQTTLVAQAAARLAPGHRRVLNATGVVVHTNLGRAPLAPSAIDALADAAAGYVDVELDLATGRRGPRAESLTRLLRELTGAEDALVVNNGAAATLLAVAALAGPGMRVAVSRGQLVEIGGGFRIPEVVAQAGAQLVEVGTTNRTRASDFARAEADLLLRVHPSNFRTIGFVEDVAIEQLTQVGPPVVDDVGSGTLDGLADEPGVRRSVQAGAAVTTFSGDKLLGGPQAGVLVGTRDAIAACRTHPLHRALRPGRLVLAALEATLLLHRDPERARRDVPVVRMLHADPPTLQDRAQRIADAVGGTVVAHEGRAGGGALPMLPLEGPAVALPGDPERLARVLRAGDPPVLARITQGRVLLDPRTLDGDAEVEQLISAVRRALAPPPTSA